LAVEKKQALNNTPPAPDFVGQRTGNIWYGKCCKERMHIQVTAATLSEWRDRSLASAETGLNSRAKWTSRTKRSEG